MLTALFVLAQAMMATGAGMLGYSINKATK